MRTHTFTITIAAVLFVGMTAGALAQNPDFKGFPDVPKNHWAFQAVTDLARRGILQGYPAEGSGDKLKAKPVALTNADAHAKPTAKHATKAKQAR